VGTAVYRDGADVSVALVSVEELDRALEAGKVQYGRLNFKTVRCAVMGCRRLCGPGEARKLFVDGIRRGMACISEHVVGHLSGRRVG
jgi:hypothetical protein